MSTLGRLTAVCQHGYYHPVEKSGLDENNLGKRWKFTDGCCAGTHPTLNPSEGVIFSLDKEWDKWCERINALRQSRIVCEAA